MKGKTINVLTVIEKGGDKREQVRLYSDRDEFLDEFNRIAKHPKRLLWSLHAVTIDEHRPWFFEDEPDQKGLGL